MSEYQWIEFRAIEAPLDADAMEFMRTQSSRADIDQWRFTNEYHYGDFHGNAKEMLRRGYDLFVHYSNYGTRSLYLRFRDGFQFADLVQEYIDDEQICWYADSSGTGGILAIDPEGDASTFEEIWEPQTLASDFIPLWEMIYRGDMRPLYLAFLARCSWSARHETEEDSPMLEPPVPPGLKQSHQSLDRLCVYLELDSDLLDVASEESADLEDSSLNDQGLNDWIQSKDRDQLEAILHRILSEPKVEPQRTLREIERKRSPTIEPKIARRSLAEMWRKVEGIEKQREEALEAERALKLAEAERKAREQHERAIQAVKADPDRILRRIDQAVDKKNRSAYQEAAQNLKLLQEALGPMLARSKAEELKIQYPTRAALHSEIKKVLDLRQ